MYNFMENFGCVGLHEKKMIIIKYTPYLFSVYTLQDSVESCEQTQATCVLGLVCNAFCRK